MKKKSLKLITVIAALAITCAFPAAVFAEEPALIASASVSDESEALPYCASYYGTVKSVSRDVKGNIVSLTLSSEESGEYIMNLSENTVFIDSGTGLKSDSSTLKKGESVYVYHSSAMTLSLPPQSYGYAVVRNVPEDTGCASLHLAKKVTARRGLLTITTDDGSLKLKTDKNTVLVDYEGNTVSSEYVSEGVRFMAWYDKNGKLSRLMTLPEEKEEAASPTLNYWTQVDDDWYYVGEDGVLITESWKKLGGKWYWFDENGKAARNEWKKLSDGKWYYFTDSCAAAENTWVTTGGKEYYLDGSCAWVEHADELSSAKSNA